MPSLATRLAISRYQTANVEAAAEAAQAAAATAAAAAVTAQTAANTANDVIADIEDGVLDLDAVKVGGQRFINSAGTLVPEP